MVTKKEFEKFKSNVDLWIKQIRSEYSEIIDYGKVVEENIGNIQHNYELIQELKEEIDNIKDSLIVILEILNNYEKIKIPKNIRLQ